MGAGVVSTAEDDDDGSVGRGPVVDDDGEAEHQAKLERGFHAELGRQFPDADEDDLENDDLTKLMLETSKRELGKKPSFQRPAGDQMRPSPVEIKTRKSGRGPASLDTKGKRLAEMSDLEIDAMLAEAGQSLSAVVELEVPDAELVERLLKRAQIEGRQDDTQDVIQHRLALYHRETEAVIRNYVDRGIVARVDGTGQIDDVTERLLQSVYAVRSATGTLPVVSPETEA